MCAARSCSAFAAAALSFKRFSPVSVPRHKHRVAHRDMQVLFAFGHLMPEPETPPQFVTSSVRSTSACSSQLTTIPFEPKLLQSAQATSHHKVSQYVAKAEAWPIGNSGLDRQRCQQSHSALQSCSPGPCSPAQGLSITDLHVLHVLGRLTTATADSSVYFHASLYLD